MSQAELGFYKFGILGLVENITWTPPVVCN